jgi:hypothetical protein
MTTEGWQPFSPKHAGASAEALKDTFSEQAAVEASWRQVDVRRLSWDHDLRPEYLAVLCLRCWSTRE